MILLLEGIVAPLFAIFSLSKPETSYANSIKVVTLGHWPYFMLKVMVNYQD